MKKIVLLSVLLSSFAVGVSAEYINTVPQIPNAYGQVLTQNGFCAKRIDVETSSSTYVAYAQQGTLDADAGWAISRIQTSGNITKIEWANGRTDFSNIWNVRGSSYTYR